MISACVKYGPGSDPKFDDSGGAVCVAEIRMCVVNARVDDGDEDARAEEVVSFWIWLLSGLQRGNAGADRLVFTVKNSRFGFSMYSISGRSDKESNRFAGTVRIP